MKNPRKLEYPTFKGYKENLEKSSNFSIGIDQYQKKFYDHINEREQRDKNPIFEEIEEIENHAYQKDFETSYGEDFAATHEDEEEDIPEPPAAKESSPIPDQVEQDAHKSKRKIKKLRDKIKTFKVLERFLKNENTLLKERNHTLISENERLK